MRDTFFYRRAQTLEALNKLGETVPVIISDNLVIRSVDGNTFEPYIPSTGEPAGRRLDYDSASYSCIGRVFLTALLI